MTAVALAIDLFIGTWFDTNGAVHGGTAAAFAAFASLAMVLLKQKLFLEQEKTLVPLNYIVQVRNLRLCLCEAQGPQPRRKTVFLFCKLSTFLRITAGTMGCLCHCLYHQHYSGLLHVTVHQVWRQPVICVQN